MIPTQWARPILISCMVRSQTHDLPMSVFGNVCMQELAPVFPRKQAQNVFHTDVCERVAWQDSVEHNSAVWIRHAERSLTDIHTDADTHTLRETVVTRNWVGTTRRLMAKYFSGVGKSRERDLGAGFGERNSFLTHTRLGWVSGPQGVKSLKWG